MAQVLGTSPSVTGHLPTVCFSAPAALVQKSWQLSRRSAPYFWLLRKRQIWQLRQKLPRSDPCPTLSRILKGAAEKGTGGKAVRNGDGEVTPT